MRKALLRLKKNVKVADDKSGTITITAQMSSPQKAADVANTMLDNLGTLVVTGSHRKADFIASQAERDEPKPAKSRG